MASDGDFPNARIRLVEAAIRLLGIHGPSEVKARSVAGEAGLSTMGVYTHFGGVPELLQAVADEGFRRQGIVFAALPITDNPMVDLSVMALACRDCARSNPHLYDLMFGLSIDGRYNPSRGTATPVLSRRSPAFQAVYAFLLEGCVRLVEAKCVTSADPAHIAVQTWSAMHGVIMLELAGHFADIADPPAQILLPLCINLVIGLGATRECAESAAAIALASWPVSVGDRPTGRRRRSPSRRNAK